MLPIPDLFSQIIHKPLTSLSIVLNLVLIESLLSVDNAAVLATMVLDLPKQDRPRALRYGILGAYIFRGACLLFAAVLIQIWWFKPLGGLYLLYLATQFFFRKKVVEKDVVAEGIIATKKNWLYRKTLGALGQFWATVVIVEVMDLAFSIDNVIAANAYSKNIILIWIGVFIGILAMRFVAQGFVRLLEKYSFLETCAYIVIALLGIKLSISAWTHFQPCSDFATFINGPDECTLSQGKQLVEGEQPRVWGDIITSVFSLTIFMVPVLTSIVFNWPHHKPKIDQ